MNKYFLESNLWLNCVSSFVSAMPVKQPVAPLPPPDQGLHPAHLQPPPATWSPRDSRNLQPRGPHARRHHRRRRREAKEAGSRREATREGPRGYADVFLRNHQEIKSVSLFFFFMSIWLFRSGHSLKYVKPKAPFAPSFVFFLFLSENLKDTSIEINFLLLCKSR